MEIDSPKKDRSIRSEGGKVVAESGGGGGSGNRCENQSTTGTPDRSAMFFRSPSVLNCIRLSLNLITTSTSTTSIVFIGKVTVGGSTPFSDRRDFDSIPSDGIHASTTIADFYPVSRIRSTWKAMLASDLGDAVCVEGEKGQTQFANDVQKFTKYTLAETSGPSVDMDYHIEVITKDDKLRILKFLRMFFFRDEPLNQSIELIPEGEDSTCLELEEYCSMSSIENNLSLMAISTSGAIVGVLLNGKMDPPCDEEPEYITSCKNEKFKKILKLLHYVDKNVNRDGKYRGLNILEIRIISVDSSWRSKGIGKALVEKALVVGREKGFHIARADCSSFFSGKLCARLGFERIYELEYADYHDEDGKPVFSPAFPHTSIATYIKKL